MNLECKPIYRLTFTPSDAHVRDCACVALIHLHTWGVRPTCIFYCYIPSPLSQSLTLGEYHFHHPGAFRAQDVWGLTRSSPYDQAHTSVTNSNHVLCMCQGMWVPWPTIIWRMGHESTHMYLHAHHTVSRIRIDILGICQGLGFVHTSLFFTFRFTQVRPFLHCEGPAFCVKAEVWDSQLSLPFDTSWEHDWYTSLLDPLCGVLINRMSSCGLVSNVTERFLHSTSTSISILERNFYRRNRDSNPDFPPSRALLGRRPNHWTILPDGYWRLCWCI